MTELLVLQDRIPVDGGYPGFLWQARMQGFRPFAVPWRQVERDGERTRLRGGYEAMPNGGRRWLRAPEQIEPDIILHRTWLSPAAESLVARLADAHPRAKVSYHPIIGWADNKWHQEECFIAGEHAGIKVDRPRTYLVAREAMARVLGGVGHQRALIIKPTQGCEGNGIWLTSPATFDAVIERLTQYGAGWYVAQQLVDNPVLLDGKRCDLRIYALVESWQPLRYKVYREAVVRVAALPAGSDSTAPFRVITNWSFNHRHGVRTLATTARYLLDYLRGRGYEAATFWDDVEALLGKVFLCLRDYSRGPRERGLDRCFYLTGVDILPSIQGKKVVPMFLEHNYVPSLAHPSPFVMGWLTRIHADWVADLRRLSEDTPVPGEVSSDPVVAIVGLEPQVAFEPAWPTELRRLARELSHKVVIVLVPWHQIELGATGVTVQPPYLTLRHGRVVAVGRAPIVPDALTMFPYAGAGVATSADERAALGRFGPQAAVRCVERQAIVASLLAEAARRGVVTNAPGPDGRWGRKDHLEFFLRHFARATGRTVRRPETYVVDGAQASLVLASLAARGLDAIVKPANKARGEGHLLVARASARALTLPAGTVVIQELLAAPLLVDGRKCDLRAYLRIDEAGSRRLEPVFARLALAPYQRGTPDAELTNTAHRRRSGFPPAIYRLDDLTGLNPTLRQQIHLRLDELLGDLLAAHRWWRQSHGVAAERRTLLWGVDVGVKIEDDAPSLSLFEVNPHPQLFRGSHSCDRQVAEMLRDDYLPQLVEVRR